MGLINDNNRDRLIKFLGRHRILSIEYYFHHWGAILLFAPVLGAGLIYIFFFFDPEPHEFQEYQQGEVQFFNSITTEGRGTSYIFKVKMADGKSISVSTSSLQMALTIIETACIEIRRFKESGNFKYKLAGNHNCEVPQNR